MDGVIAGGFSSSYNYMKKHDTIDGSTEEVLAGIKSRGQDGFEFGFAWDLTKDLVLE